MKKLRAFAQDAPVVPILVQLEPDPDAMASALAVRTLLGRAADNAPIISRGDITRPENRRMAELLDIRVTRVTEAELRGYDRMVAVDVQPIVEAGPEFAVIDHHPEREGYAAELRDIRPHYGAAATILTEYLRADDEASISERLATALLYGIRTDTDTLMRGAIAADVLAYAFLQDRVDESLLRRVGRPSVSIQSMRAFGRAVAALEVEDGIAAAFLGELDEEEAHVLPNLADAVLGIEGVAWSVAAACFDDRLVLALRHVGDAKPGAGEIARALVREDGRGGGHATMARAVLSKRRLPPHQQPSPQSVLRLVADAIEGLRGAGAGVG